MSSDFKPGDAVAQQVQRIPRSGIREFFDLVQEAAQLTVAPLRNGLPEGGERLRGGHIRCHAGIARLLMQERMRLWRVAESDVLAKLVGALQPEAVAIGDDREDERAAVGM